MGRDRQNFDGEMSMISAESKQRGASTGDGRSRRPAEHPVAPHRRHGGGLFLLWGKGGRDAALAAGFLPISPGDIVPRVETAALSCISTLRCEFDRAGPKQLETNSFSASA